MTTPRNEEPNNGARKSGTRVTAAAMAVAMVSPVEAEQNPPVAPESLQAIAPNFSTNLQIIPAGQSPSGAPASNFTGTVAVMSAFKGTGGARLGRGTVTFQPGGHTNWHTHPLGQLLIVTKGAGWVQIDGEPAKAIEEGDTVWIAPGMKHWHGAARNTAMTRVAVSEALDGRSVTWLKPMPDEQYDKLR